ncbi:MAG: hypothetical protein U0Q18_25385 [Bryobacteraceae bacterium]
MQVRAAYFDNYDGFEPEYFPEFSNNPWLDPYAASLTNPFANPFMTPPFALWYPKARIGTGSQLPADLIGPSHLLTAVPNITGWQDLVTPSGGYPTAPGQAPNCSQPQPNLAWSGGYLPEASWSEWIKDNPLKAAAIGVLAVLLVRGSQRRS